MFGKRSTLDVAAGAATESVHPTRPPPPPPTASVPPASAAVSDRAEPQARSSRADPNNYFEVKTKVFEALLETVDLTQLSTMDAQSMREELSDVCREIINVKGYAVGGSTEETLIREICDDMLGLGPLEPLLARDDIADIMVNGPYKVYIEANGRVEETPIRFRDSAHLMNVCQRIVSAVGRRVDEASPICDARLADGSRVNVIAPPLALDGPTLTIRKFKREKLTLDKLVEFGSLSETCATIIRIASAARCNILISGGTGSGKTTLLNCLTKFIGSTERIVTCEDAAELQLQQPHVVRLETRPKNLEGVGEVTMRDLVRNCLRMRPDRIIVGEVRGPEAFDLLQAMNTGHSGSMGTVHANTPRDALSRLENMIAMGGFNIPTAAVREQIASALDVVVQAERLRDGSRKITQVAEVLGLEGDVIVTQTLFEYVFLGEDNRGRVLGEHRPTGIRPHFAERARYHGLDKELIAAIEQDSPD